MKISYCHHHNPNCHAVIDLECFDCLSMMYPLDQNLLVIIPSLNYQLMNYQSKCLCQTHQVLAAVTYQRMLKYQAQKLIIAVFDCFNNWIHLWIGITVMVVE